jgi:regulatory ArsR family protein
VSEPGERPTRPVARRWQSLSTWVQVASILGSFAAVVGVIFAIIQAGGSGSDQRARPMPTATATGGNTSPATPTPTAPRATPNYEVARKGKLILQRYWSVDLDSGRQTMDTFDRDIDMYDETDDDGKRKHTVAQIAAELGVSRPTIYRHLAKTAGLAHPAA